VDVSTTEHGGDTHDVVSEKSAKRSDSSVISRTSSKSYLMRKTTGVSLITQAILHGNEMLPLQKQIKIKPSQRIRRNYPPCHIKSAPIPSPNVKKVLSSNLDGDDLSEADLVESLSYNTSKPPTSDDIFADGICVKFHFSYDGNASLTFGADVSLDLPTVQNFVSFPMTISVSHLVIEGDLVVELRDKVVKVYLERDIHGPLRDFQFTVHFGDDNDYVYVDKHQIGTFLKNTMQVFIEKEIMFPNFQLIDISKHMETAKPK
jgi:hypothetical protein